jgi:hypothetical protein
MMGNMMDNMTDTVAESVLILAVTTTIDVKGQSRILVVEWSVNESFKRMLQTEHKKLLVKPDDSYILVLSKETFRMQTGKKDAEGFEEYTDGITEESLTKTGTTMKEVMEQLCATMAKCKYLVCFNIKDTLAKLRVECDKLKLTLHTPILIDIQSIVNGAKLTPWSALRSIYGSGEVGAHAKHDNSEMECCLFIMLALMKRGQWKKY